MAIGSLGPGGRSPIDLDAEDEDAAHAAKPEWKRGRMPSKYSAVDNSLLNSDFVLDFDFVSNVKFLGGNETHAVKPKYALLSVLESDAELLGRNEAHVVMGKRSIKNSVTINVALLDSVNSEIDVELLVVDQMTVSAFLGILLHSTVPLNWSAVGQWQ